MSMTTNCSSAISAITTFVMHIATETYFECLLNMKSGTAIYVHLGTFKGSLDSKTTAMNWMASLLLMNKIRNKRTTTSQDDVTVDCVLLSI
jgi:hypothetical protein